MYKIYADDTLIYDSTIENFKIGKGQGALETNKSGSFVFSLYPDHFYYDSFVRLKTVITVYKSGRIVFRGRVLSDVTDHHNNKVLTCGGELDFLQDTIVRPFVHQGSPEALFRKFIEDHNAQVDEFKRFKIGSVTVVDENDYIYRSGSTYETTLAAMNSRFPESALGGYFYITHGDDGTDPIPTIHYLADFPHVSEQTIEFGVNLKNYTKTVKGEEIATALIPLGAPIDDGDDSTEDAKLTIASVNGGVDYVYSPAGVALYGWIFKVEEWTDVTVAANLKAKAEARVEELIKQNVTIELTAIDLHLLDRSIESFRVCDYIRVISPPHKFDSVMLCNKQTFDILRPDNDTVTLGYTYATFTETSGKVSASVKQFPTIRATVERVNAQVLSLNETVEETREDADKALADYEQVAEDLGTVSGDIEAVAGVVTENARNIATNAENIAKNAANIAANAGRIDANAEAIADLASNAAVRGVSEEITVAAGATGALVVTFAAPFEAVPEVVLISPVAATLITAAVTAIRADGFTVSLNNPGEAAVTAKVMFVVYPPAAEEVTA